MKLQFSYMTLKLNLQRFPGDTIQPECLEFQSFVAAPVYHLRLVVLIFRILFITSIIVHDSTVHNTSIEPTTSGAQHQELVCIRYRF